MSQTPHITSGVLPGNLAEMMLEETTFHAHEVSVGSEIFQDSLHWPPEMSFDPSSYILEDETSPKKVAEAALRVLTQVC